MEYVKGLKLSELKLSARYRCLLSGNIVIITEINDHLINSIPTSLKPPVRAMYYNEATGRYEFMESKDGQLASESTT